jgi:uncharacterized protein YndB with AHSA1/START domain
MTTDRIERSIELQAAPARVWRALTHHREFGSWFRVHLDQPFAVGTPSTGHITYPGYEHIRWDATIVAMEPERRFAFTWHPAAVERDVDYSGEAPTTVEFTLAPHAGGTRLTVTETGFEHLPEDRRFTALRMNTEGWSAQLDNIAAYLASHGAQ